MRDTITVRMTPEPTVTLRDATPDDGDGLAAIYNPYVVETVVTFEEDALTGAAMARRVADIHEAGLPWLVAMRNGRVIGYAYASPWKARRSYRFSVETSVYLERDAGGAGVGTMLYTALFARLRASGLHSVIGGISLPNAASVALHEKMGMTKVAHFPEVGFKLGRWIDVGYWHVVL
jgi:phosphinothricin acetyltransferase